MRAVQYRIVGRGHVSDRFATTFDGMATEPGRDETAARSRVRAQAHLERLRDFWLELLRVEKDAR